MKTATPGQIVAQEDGAVAGEGCYAHNGAIYSSRAGVVRQTPEGAWTVTVPADPRHNVLPQVGDFVLGTVVRVDSRIAVVRIQCVGAQAASEALRPTREDFDGVIRAEDVRATERDSVNLYRCFRPGDIVKARVHSLGDSFGYLLTTAANELGVLFARSAASGLPLVPQSWATMACPQTHAVEHRKCAQPV